MSPNYGAMSGDYVAKQGQKIYDILSQVQLQLNQLIIDYNAGTKPTTAQQLNLPLPDMSFLTTPLVS